MNKYDKDDDKRNDEDKPADFDDYQLSELEENILAALMCLAMLMFFFWLVTWDFYAGR